jgi:restriction system protein
LQEPLSLLLLKKAAKDYAEMLTNTPIPALYGVTDGKAVGTFVEVGFNGWIAENYDHTAGNAARGIDFPDLNVDLKVTSIKQPQSSSPFRSATQKVYGLGYHLLLIVYEKSDDPSTQSAHLEIQNVVFIPMEQTADYTLTRGVNRIVEDGGTDDDVDAYLEDRNLPLDPESRRQLAERILEEPPALGYITISNALQWRLQYNHAIRASLLENVAEVESLYAK